MLICTLQKEMSCINCTDGANESQSNGALKNLRNNNNFSWNNNKMRKQKNAWKAICTLQLRKMINESWRLK